MLHILSSTLYHITNTIYSEQPLIVSVLSYRNTEHVPMTVLFLQTSAHSEGRAVSRDDDVSSL